jgi:hypothetical protein
MNTIYKSAQAALLVKDYAMVVQLMKNEDFDYVIGDAEYMVSVWSVDRNNTFYELRSNDNFERFIQKFD